MTEAATDCAPPPRRFRAAGPPVPRLAFLHYDAGELWSRFTPDLAMGLGALARQGTHGDEPGSADLRPAALEVAAFLREPATLELLRGWCGQALRPLIGGPVAFVQLQVEPPGAAWPRPRWPEPDRERPVVLHLFLSTHENGEGGALELRVATASANSLVVRPYRGHAVLFAGAMPHRVHPVATGLDGTAKPRLCLEAAFAPVEG